jgi:hypothetical protein
MEIGVSSSPSQLFYYTVSFFLKKGKKENYSYYILFEAALQCSTAPICTSVDDCSNRYQQLS